MSVEKRRGGYCVRWRDSAGIARSKQVALYRDAVSLDGEMRRKKAMGELIVHERGTVCMTDFWTVWWRNYALVHLTDRTRGVYEHLWWKHLDPAIGRVPVRELRRQHVAELTTKLSGTLGSSSVRKCLAILQGVLERAVEWEYIPTNPVRGARKPKLIEREGRALSPDELAALITELPELRSRTVATVLAGTGLRPGELRALRWGDVADNVILVNKAASSDQVGPTKTNGRRAVVVRPAVSKALAEWWLVRGKRDERSLMFPGRDGKLWSDTGWRGWQRQVFTPAAAYAGLAGVVPYDLRHTFASMLIAEGRDIYWIARQLGHSPTMTLTTYGHLFETNYQGARDDRPTADDRWGTAGAHRPAG